MTCLGFGVSAIEIWIHTSLFDDEYVTPQTQNVVQLMNGDLIEASVGYRRSRHGSTHEPDSTSTTGSPGKAD